ncbi:family 78 glycoside hydrolase catalytic domain [Paenibacillus sp. GCM10027626]|uniref:family 78 glycoside hydrolase catalytic domain n=1 Tax=Paenibacillus sp. GCM10027626 TaxID=3273411 RepID=UPI003637F7FC
MTKLKLEALTCNYRVNPLGTDGERPHFSWKLLSERRGTRQTSYRIQVSGHEADFTRLLWDSGKVDSEQSIQVLYGGPDLRSQTRYSYRVNVWDNYGRESGWSDVAWWETGLLAANEWKASWITPDPEHIDPHAKPVFLLRKHYKLKSGIVRARMYATAAGVYEVFVNGSRVGDALFAPGWTSYNKRHQVQTYDVTGLLKSGGNAIGVMVGDGWYKGELVKKDNRNYYGSQRAVLLQLHVRYKDGSEEVIASNSSWKCATGPVLLSEIYAGELYDARLERSGWTTAQYDEEGWCAAVVCSLPYAQLVPQENEPVRVIETLYPQAVIHTPAGECVLDMGQNMVGRMRLTLNVPAGTHIKLRHAEVLDKEGNFYTGNLRHAEQAVEYIAKGGGTESYAPCFTFQGFRYVKVEGWQAADNVLLGSFAGEVIHSDMEQTGEFSCSHPLVNRLQQNIVWGQRGNFLDVPTDCPQRDERLGWTGDAQVFIRTAAFNYQVGPFFTKWLRDLKADQRPDGGVPSVIPDVLGNHVSGTMGTSPHSSAAWGDAAVICPWITYISFADIRLLESQYESMKAWVDFVRGQGEDELLWNTGKHYGDWLALDAKENSYIGATPKDLIATAYFAYCASLLQKAANVLKRTDDAQYYSELAERIKARFNEEFVTPSGRLASPTQTAHVLALQFGLVEGGARERTARELNRLVEENGYRLTTGFVGTPYLCQALSDNGYHETAVKLLVQESYPSWLYSVVKGATTIWEHWDGIKPDGSFWSDNMNSFNHYAYGAIGDWLYRYVAGLDMNEAEPAYKRVRIHPRFGADGLSTARAVLNSPYGRIESAWRIDNGQVELSVIVPPNTSAEIVLPGARLLEVAEGGRLLADVLAEHRQTAAETTDGVRFLVGSGRYHFSYRLTS